ncbi:MAG: NADH-quinone oxidoreductase subunit A [Sandaracinaceae bacterium]
MLAVYLPVVLMFVVAVTIPVLMFVLTSLLGPKNPTPEKLIPYESGSETEGARHVRLSVKFYLTAILFVVFDIEAVFLYPWASQFRGLGWFGLAEMMLFITVLVVTLVYAWRKGALEWER